MIFGFAINYKIPHQVIFSSLLLLLFSSQFCSQTFSIYVLPLGQEIKFQTNIKQQQKILAFCILSSNFYFFSYDLGKSKTLKWTVANSPQMQSADNVFANGTVTCCNCSEKYEVCRSLHQTNICLFWFYSTFQYTKVHSPTPHSTFRWRQIQLTNSCWYDSLRQVCPNLVTTTWSVVSQKSWNPYYKVNWKKNKITFLCRWR